MTDLQLIELFEHTKSNHNYLFIIPDLDLNGANTVLLELLSVIIESHGSDSSHFIISPTAGSLASSYENLGCHVWIRENVYCSPTLRRLLQTQFDYVFLNTSSVHFYSLFFINCDTRVYWWFHESYEQLSLEQTNFIHLGLVSNNFRILGVTDKVLRGLKDIYGITAQALPMIIKDEYVLSAEAIFNTEEAPITKPLTDTEAKIFPNEETAFQASKAISPSKITFFIPGAYTYIKGQDLLLKVISELPDEYKDNSHFIFAGYKLPAQEEYYQLLRKISSLLPNTTMLDSITRSEVYHYMNNCNCIIAPSRVDSTPTTIIEAMMHQKLCLVSSGAGISDYLTDCVNGFVFPNEDAEELKKRLVFIISELILEGRDSLDSLSVAGRKVYEEIFSADAVVPKMKLLEII